MWFLPCLNSQAIYWSPIDSHLIYFSLKRFWDPWSVSIYSSFEFCKTCLNSNGQHFHVLSYWEKKFPNCVCNCEYGFLETMDVSCAHWCDPLHSHLMWNKIANLNHTSLSNVYYSLCNSRIKALLCSFIWTKQSIWGIFQFYCLSSFTSLVRGLMNCRRVLRCAVG